MPSAGALKAGRAVIEMGLSTDGVQSGLDKLQGSLKKFGNQLASIGKQAALVGGAITAGFGAAVKTFVSLGSELADASARTGVAVEDLSALKFAAEQSGASFETLEKGIRFLQKSGGSFGDIPVLADQIASISDPAERARLAIERFGRSAGPELLPLLSTGSAGLKQLMDQARATGNVMSGETAMAAEQLGDAFDVVKTQLATLLVNIATAVSGDLQKFTDSIIQITTRIIHWVQQHQTLIRVVAGTGAALLGLGTSMIVLGQTFIKLSAAIKLVFNGLTYLSKHPWLVVITVGTVAIGEMTGAFDALGRKIDEVIGVADEAKQISGLTKEFDKLTKQVDSAKDEMAAFDSIEVERAIEVAARFQPALASAAAVGQRSGPRTTESIFDTRLAKQIFGERRGERVEDEQLKVQKQIELNTRNFNPGIPVVP